MSSRALQEWQGARANRLDELVAAHERVGGTGAGRRTETEQINWALVLRLAAEFQGFARDLHGEGVDTFSRVTAGSNTAVERTISTLLTLNLNLDRGNADPSALGDAFNRFGISWWPSLRQRDQRTATRQEHLARLNRARNAIAHARLDELQALRTDGYPITLDTVRIWRSALNGLTETMDKVLAAHLAALLQQGEPW